jgi:branched-subunit amino acid aminotransferase/4-amino-4-deoxychorismate lyase
VILLNETGEVSECTSANIFIAQGSHIWTPPLSSGCLPGVTKQLLLTEIVVPGITIGERTLKPADLEAADEVFITSTTRALLPVISIEGLNINKGASARQPVQEAFERYVESYVAGMSAIAGNPA